MIGNCECHDIFLLIDSADICCKFKNVLRYGLIEKSKNISESDADKTFNSLKPRLALLINFLDRDDISDNQAIDEVQAFSKLISEI